MRVRPRAHVACLTWTTVALVLWAATAAAPARADIYGEDDRYELYEVGDAKLRRWARAVAVMVPKRVITSKGVFRSGIPTLSETRRNVSAGRPQPLPVIRHERFADQPLYGRGTGFLVAPDLLVTAGHCIKSSEDLKNYYWVFDYALDPSTQRLRKSVGMENVFEAREVIFSTRTKRADRSTHDYALIRLARPATATRDGKPNGRRPLEFRRKGRVNDTASLVMIGYPMGLPMKVTDSGRIRANTAKTSFTTTLDAFGGNSGSPVLDAQTGLVEGILVRGTRVSWKEIVVDGRSFAETIKFAEEGGGYGTDVERITNIKALREGLGHGMQIFDAIRIDDLAGVRRLIDSGAKLEGVKDAEGRNFVHVALARRNLDLLRLFLEKRVSHKARDRDGNTPLHVAARHGFLEGIQALMEKRPPVNVVNNDGETPYHLANSEGHRKVATLLVARGANRKIKPKDYQHLSEELIRAARRGDVSRVAELKSMPGVDVNLGDDTALIWAAYQGHERVIAALLTRRDLAVNYENSRGANALFWAKAKNRPRITQVLLARGARDGRLARSLRSKNRPDLKPYQPQLKFGCIVKDREARDLDRGLLTRIRAGDSAAIFRAGMERTRKSDWRAAAGWFQRAARRGNAAAMNNLAVCYQSGQGVDSDAKRAFGLYRDAARLGNATAMRNVGLCYEHGRGVRRSRGDALAWYVRAKARRLKNIDRDIARVRPSADTEPLTAASFREQVLASDYLAVVYFRDGNKLCRVFDAIFSKAKRSRSDRARFLRLDREAPDAAALFSRYGVVGTPSVMFFKRGIRAAKPLVGLRTQASLVKAIDGHLKPE